MKTQEMLVELIPSNFYKASFKCRYNNCNCYYYSEVANIYSYEKLVEICCLNFISPGNCADSKSRIHAFSNLLIMSRRPEYALPKNFTELFMAT